METDLKDLSSISEKYREELSNAILEISQRAIKEVSHLTTVSVRCSIDRNTKSLRHPDKEIQENYPAVKFIFDLSK